MNHVEAAALPDETGNSVRQIDFNLEDQESKIARAVADSNIIVELDPETVRFSSFPNRDASSLSDESFVDLEEDMSKNGGNNVPIEVRPLKEVSPEGHRFEVCSGHKRLVVATRRGFRIRCTIVHVDDQQLLLRRLSENTGRTDFSALELGRICLALKEKGSYVNNRQLALAITRDEGLVSKAMTLASLPIEIIEAFESSRELQYRYAKPLSDALEARYELVMTRARDIKAKGGTRTPAEVFTMLIDGAKASTAVAPAPEKAPADGTLEPFKQAAADREFKVDGKPVGKLTTDKKGQVRALIKTPLEPDVFASLHEAMCRVLASNAKRVAKAKANAVGKVTP